jgi:transposase
LSTGCQWRALPKDLPPKSTVHDYFILWSCDGTLDRIHHALYVACREQAEREASPTAAIIDSPSVKTAEKGGHPFLQTLFADAGYQGRQFHDALKKILPHLRTQIVKRSDQAKGFVVLPKRWIVERTLAWLNRCRRLTKDWENLNRTALAFLRLASIRLMLRKLCNPHRCFRTDS